MLRLRRAQLAPPGFAELDAGAEAGAAAGLLSAALLSLDLLSPAGADFPASAAPGFASGPDSDAGTLLAA